MQRIPRPSRARFGKSGRDPSARTCRFLPRYSKRCCPQRAPGDRESMSFWLTIQLDLVTSWRILMLVDKQSASRDGMAYEEKIKIKTERKRKIRMENKRQSKRR